MNRLNDLVGGPARRKVVLVLATVLGLESADLGAVSATASQLQAAFHVGKTDIGLLLAITQLVGAACTLPFGVLVDRIRRTRLLTAVAGLWAVAMGISGVAPSFLFLLLTRLFLGAVTAVAYPAIASLIGDYFPPAERGQIYGFVASGELIGAGFGIVVAGGAASAFATWRAAFFALALPSLAIVWLIRRLPEPTRGGTSRMPPGTQELPEDSARAGGPHQPTPTSHSDGQTRDEPGLARQVVRRSHVAPQ
ncbi:MAG TPA: MFS transporter, partial [Acidimicrobiales bacterium]|nr:MFS transporter [Acidimicrobiales bacterium]